MKAEALCSLGRWPEAEPILRALATSDGPFFKSAKLGLAEAMRALGKPGPAVRELETRTKALAQEATVKAAQVAVLAQDLRYE